MYRTLGEKYGVKYSEEEILMRYRQAYAQPWGRSRLRYAISFFDCPVVPDVILLCLRWLCKMLLLRTCIGMKISIYIFMP